MKQILVGFEVWSDKRTSVHYQSKVWTHLLIYWFFFIFMTIYVVDSHWRHQNYEWTHIELCSKKKKCEITQSRHPLLCWQCCKPLALSQWANELHDVVTWNGFHLTGEPCQGSFVEFLAFLMGLGPSVVLCRSQVGTQLTALFDNC